MQFLRTAFWVVVAVAIALFTKANWDIAPSESGRVPVKLWADWLLYIRLPVLLFAAFLLGLLPTWIFARVGRWRMRRRLHSAEQALAASMIGTSATLPVSEVPTAEQGSDDPAISDAPAGEGKL